MARGPAIGRWPRLAFNLLSGGERRQRALLALRRPAGLFQPSGTTTRDRYPELFARVRDLVGADAARLLSFGCSTGDEVAALLALFPSAGVRGLDIVPARIAAAQRRVRDPRASFAVAASAVAEPEASFDAVFALAVFRHGDLGGAPITCAPLLSFAAFEREIGVLVALLRVGGVLAIRHANCRVEDTAAARLLEPIQTMPTRTPLYGRDERLSPGDTETVLFRKAAGSAA